MSTSSRGKKVGSEKFERFVVVDLGLGFGDKLYGKLCRQYPRKESSLLLPEKERDWFKGERKIDSPTRVYIIAHGSAGEGCVAGEDGSQYDVNELAEKLARFIGEYDCKEGKVEINLVTCHAASSTNEERNNSFAQQLIEKLSKDYGKSVTVIARSEFVMFYKGGVGGGRKYTANRDGVLANLRIKAPGSKHLFKHNKEGVLEKVDAYQHRWKKQLMAVLTEMLSTAQVEEKRAFLQDWLTQFKSKSAEEVYATVENELEKSDSVISEHFSSRPSTLFSRQPARYAQLNELVSKGSHYFPSTAKKKLPSREPQRKRRTQKQPSSYSIPSRVKS